MWKSSNRLFAGKNLDRLEWKRCAGLQPSVAREAAIPLCFPALERGTETRTCRRRQVIAVRASAISTKFAWTRQFVGRLDNRRNLTRAFALSRTCAA